MLASKNLLNDPPKAILLNIYIVYAADNTIELLAKAPNKGNLSNVRYKDKNSPTKFKVSGVPALPKQSIKKKIENKGIICATPLYKLIDLVDDLSYSTPPTQINRPLETKP